MTVVKARRTWGKGWAPAVPLLLVVAIAFGIPAVMLAVGAFTVKGAPGEPGSYGFDNLAASLREPYLGTLLTSVRLSAVVAVAGALTGTFLAHAVLTSKSSALREAVLSVSGVLANFGGVPLAFIWIATLGNSGVITTSLGLGSGLLYNFWGLALVYLYFSIPLMVLVIAPALEGLRPQWREAALNNGATTWQFWRLVGIPVLAPALLGGVVLLFGGAFAAYATAAAMVGASVPLVTLQIADALTGNVLVGFENVALALSLDMVVVALLVMAVYLPLQRRSSRWLR
ncbi:ABC transporter permease [Acrocarpospora phusangensis]|uniref:ABC transporter permease n=1 Tax=Acrocarpospora phusangensis TaxID=1070424 RepID=A0A919UL78_9ACTN|nr:ABC transporter permease subunit [Acrocarpospora phusangensis]GIH21872.1 ABC transporter permease [Acrocarpospora phusangensis]